MIYSILGFILSFILLVSTFYIVSNEVTIGTLVISALISSISLIALLAQESTIKIIFSFLTPIGSFICFLIVLSIEKLDKKLF